MRGQRYEFGNPGAAQAVGIETVFQDLALADSLPAGENVFPRAGAAQEGISPGGSASSIATR